MSIRVLHQPLTGNFPPERAADPTFDLVVEELGRARESVEIFMYVWRADRVGTRIGKAILEAAGRGLRVRILKDVGAFMYERIEMNRKSFFNRDIGRLKRLVYRLLPPTFPDTFVEDGFDQELGGELLAHPNVTVEWVNHTHTKYYLFDERLLVTGSINIEDRHQRYYDYMFAIDDEALVRHLRQRLGGEAPYDSTRSLEIVCNTRRPEGSMAFEIKSEVLRLIREARTSIYVEVAYLGDPEVTNALIEAAGRSIEITFLFSRDANIGNDLNYRTMHEIYTRAGVQVYLTPTMIHSKLMLFDDETVLAGSCNLSIFSLQKAAELNLVIREEPELISTLRDIITRRIGASHQVTNADELSSYNRLLASLQQLHQRWNPA